MAPGSMFVLVGVQRRPSSSRRHGTSSVIVGNSLFSLTSQA